MSDQTLRVLKWIVNPCEQNSPDDDDEPSQMSPELIAGNLKWNLTLQAFQNLDNDICQLQIGITSRDSKQPLKISGTFISCTNKWGSTLVALPDVITVESDKFTLFSPFDVSLRCFNYEAIEIRLYFIVHIVGIDDKQHISSDSDISSQCSWFSASSKTPSPVSSSISPNHLQTTPIWDQPLVNYTHQHSVPPPPSPTSVYTFIYGNILSDVTLTCQDHYFHCHKSVLASRSSVFAAMLGSNLWDAFNPIISLSCVDYATLYDIVQYIYTGTVPELAKKAFRLLRPATIYQLDELTMACETILCQQLNIDNAVELLMLSYSCETVRLKGITVKFVVQHIDDMLQMEDFTQAMQNNGSVCFDVMKKALKK